MCTHTLASPYFPNPHRFVIGSGHDILSVGREMNRGHRTGVKFVLPALFSNSFINFVEGEALVVIIQKFKSCKVYHMVVMSSDDVKGTPYKGTPNIPRIYIN